MNTETKSITRFLNYLRTNGGHVLVEALVNFILPFVIYSYAEAPLGDVRALLLSSAPPIAWSLVEFARHRRVDALSGYGDTCNNPQMLPRDTAMTAASSALTVGRPLFGDGGAIA